MKRRFVSGWLVVFGLCFSAWLSPACSGSDENPGTGGKSGASGDAGTGKCGNGIVETGEDCDDANTDDTDGCTSSCRFTCVPGPGGNASCTNYKTCDGQETCTVDHVCAPAASPAPNGTQCGQNSSCQDGLCTTIPKVCGDGLKYVDIQDPTQSEECDDGNQITGDGCDYPSCTWTCISTDPARCISTDICAGTGTCNDTTHLCRAGTPLGDGASCGAGLTCHGGVCTSKYCGNGAIDTGEECDDGNTIQDDGCQNDCKWSCVSTDPTRNCTPLDPCQGTATCNDTTHTCGTRTPLANGTPCGNGSVCQSGACKVGLCGDGFVDVGEDCDDRNTNDYDGCTTACKFTCTLDSDCNDGKQCTQDVCTLTTHTCSHPADSSQTNQACTDGSITGTCKNGWCVGALCGNNVINTGEQCDKGSNGGTGCLPNCQYACNSDADCDDGNPCNGNETCQNVVAGGRKCLAGTALPTGTVCSTSSPRRVCSSTQQCVYSMCGDGVLDTGATPAEQCEPPGTATCDAACQTICDLSGTWALKLTTNVTWPALRTAFSLGGSGQILTWGKIVATQSGTSVATTVISCGVTVPDFQNDYQGNAGLGLETYGLTFPTTIFDNHTLPLGNTTATLSGLKAGSTYSTTSVASLVGIDGIPNPETWPWSDPLTCDQTCQTGILAQFQPYIQDHDQDGHPGVTAIVNTGTGYSLPPIGPPDANGVVPRATQVYLALRQVASVSGTLSSCTDISGSASVTQQNSRTVGCTTDTGGQCDALGITVLDGGKPLYVPVTASFVMKKIGATDGCPVVRSTLP